MRKSVEIIIAIVILANTVPITALGADAQVITLTDIEGMMRESIDCRLIIPFSGKPGTSFAYFVDINDYGKTYRDDAAMVDWLGELNGLAYYYGIPISEDEQNYLMKEYRQLMPNVCEEDKLDEAVRFVFGVGLDDVLAFSYCEKITYNGMPCVITGAPGRGDSYPGYEVNLIDMENLKDNVVYISYNVTDLMAPDDLPSNTIYAILEEEVVCGKELIGYKYLSLVPPDESLLTTYRSDRNPEVSVMVNGIPVQFDQPPIIVDGRTLVPVRAVFEAIGCIVDWDNAEQKITITDDDNYVVCWVGLNVFNKYRNGKLLGSYQLDVGPQIVNGRTVVPIRALCEAFGYSVNWDNATNTVDITGNKSAAEFLESSSNLTGKVDYKEIYGALLKNMNQVDEYIEQSKYKESTSVDFKDAYLVDMDNNGEPELMCIYNNDEIRHPCACLVEYTGNFKMKDIPFYFHSTGGIFNCCILKANGKFYHYSYGSARIFDGINSRLAFKETITLNENGTEIVVYEASSDDGITYFVNGEKTDAFDYDYVSNNYEIILDSASYGYYSWNTENAKYGKDYDRFWT